MITGYRIGFATGFALTGGWTLRTAWSVLRNPVSRQFATARRAR